MKSKLARIRTASIPTVVTLANRTVTFEGNGNRVTIPFRRVSSPRVGLNVPVVDGDTYVGVIVRDAMDAIEAAQPEDPMDVEGIAYATTGSARLPLAADEWDALIRYGQRGGLRHAMDSNELLGTVNEAFMAQDRATSLYLEIMGELHGAPEAGEFGALARDSDRMADAVHDLRARLSRRGLKASENYLENEALYELRLIIASFYNASEGFTKLAKLLFGEELEDDFQRTRVEFKNVLRRMEDLRDALKLKISKRR
jgi:hypothetical protein